MYYVEYANVWREKKPQIEYTKLDSLCVVRSTKVNARIFCDCAKFFPRIFCLKSRLHIVIENRLIRYIHGNSLANFTIFLFGAVNIWFVIHINRPICMLLLSLFHSNQYLFTVLSVLQFKHTIQLQISISIAITLHIHCSYYLVNKYDKLWRSIERWNIKKSRWNHLQYCVCAHGFHSNCLQ